MRKFKTSYTRRGGGMFHDCIWARDVESAKAMLVRTVDDCPVTMGVMFDGGKTVCTVTKAGR